MLIRDIGDVHVPLSSSAIADQPRTSIIADRWAWSVCWLMFAGTVLCYMDRQAIALVKSAVMADFGLSDDESYGWVMASFGMAYALFQVPAGFLADASDVGKLYALAVAGWSLAGVAAAFSPTLGVLIACRVALGLGESFNWPCALRITSRILPPAERGLGNGIFNSGAAVGAVIAPLTIPSLALWSGWRAAFVMVGGLGFLWVAAWLAIRGGNPRAFAAPVVEKAPSRGMSTRGRVAFAGLAFVSIAVALTSLRYGPRPVWWGIALLMMGALIVARLLPRADLGGSSWAEGLAEIVRLRRFWVLVVVGVSVNICWNFLVYWMASFLQVDRKLGMLVGGMVSALPFLAADAGNILGGGLSGFLARKGISLIRARTAVIAFGAVLIACGATIGWLRNTAMIVVVLSIMAVGAAAYMANYFALCQDVSPRSTGLVVGVLGGLANLFASGFLPIAGHLREVTSGFGTAFAIAGLLPLAGVAALILGWGPDPSAAESN